MEFSGRLGAFAISDILQWAHNDRRSGALVVRRSDCEKRVYLREGDVVACISDDPAEFFGQSLLTQGLIDEAGLLSALTHCQQSGRMLGRALQELGLLTHEQVVEALGQHAEDQICDIFLWRSGVFYFTLEMLREERLLPNPISAVQLAMEGSRWSDENQRIRRVFVHDNIVLQQGRRRLERPTPLEARILAAVDGEMSLSELYTEVRGSFFRFLSAAYRMAVAEALDIVAVGDKIDSHSTELRLADLLIEQVTEEQTVVFRRHLAVPFDVLENCVPVWTRRPDAGELQQTPQVVRQFSTGIDGETALGALLADGGDEDRGRCMEWLILQLRKGTLALLPARLSVLESEAAKTGKAERDRWWRRVLP